MILKELFNTNVPFEIKADSGSKIRYRFEVNKMLFSVVFSKYKERVWVFSFSNVSKKSIQITGSGSALEVFSSIKTIFFDFIKRKNPDEIKFAADAEEPSRVKLYDRFVKLLSGQFDVERSTDPHEIYYSLRRKW